MSIQFDNLKKLPTAPAAGILARAGARLETPLEAPAGAPAAELLAELHARGAVLDMLQVLAHTLPAREATWWACLAARDVVAGGPPPRALAAAEAWVFQPGDETRTGARAALDAAPNDDETALCAMAACFAKGTLGPADLDAYDAPAGAVGVAAYGMALTALFADEERVEAQGQILLGRALDIARGGNGKAEAEDDAGEGSP